MTDLKSVRTALRLLSAVSLTLAAVAGISGCERSAVPDVSAVAEDYANLAETVFADTLAGAEELDNAVTAFLEEPGEAGLERARDAWRAARIPYAQSEVFRFAHPVVDAREPQINAWPLDEGFIDYVDAGTYAYELGNRAGRANIVASERLQLGGKIVDLVPLTPELLAGLNETAGSEANVATGWHAIEFLLWGQDLNGTGPGAGERPWTDYAVDERCTNDNCDRRRDYLAAVTDLLVDDLRYLHSQWAASVRGNYRAEFLALPAEMQLRRILHALGSLALGELAGERMKVALMANSTEDEHDCFSDNTHNTLYYNSVGIANVLQGRYTASDGTTYDYVSILGLIAGNPALRAAVEEALADTASALAKLQYAAAEGRAFDQLIAPGNRDGAALIQGSIDALVTQTAAIESLAASLNIGALEPDDADHEF